MSSVVRPLAGPSELLGNRYSLTKRIAAGGMGEVWAGVDTLLGRSVAIKILRQELVDAPGFLKRFRAEARHTASLAHPGIASVFDYGEEGVGGDCLAYLVMELVDGVPLSRLLAERRVLPVDEAVSMLAQIAEALHAAHVRGVVHRDVKPGNVLVRDDGSIKVTDFGVATAIDATAITDVGQVVGTARYLSPEQAAGSKATAASDIYSLGVIGYEMLVGHPPFTAENPAALAMAHAHQPPPPVPQNVPADVGSLIDRALSKDPASRPADAHAFAVELRRFSRADHPSVAETRVMDANEASRTAVMPAAAVHQQPRLGVAREISADRRRRRLIVAIALIAALLLGVAVAQRGVDDKLTNVTPPPSTAPPPSSTAVTLPPTTVVVANNANNGNNGNGSGHGHGKAKGKDKGGD